MKDKSFGILKGRLKLSQVEIHTNYKLASLGAFHPWHRKHFKVAFEKDKKKETPAESEAHKWILKRAQGNEKESKEREKEKEDERKRGIEPYINDQHNNPFDHIPDTSPRTVPSAGFNGATLENSASNAFALIELSGLKWRCYKTPSTAPRGVHLSQDDVLKAYSRCIREGIVATWRRKPPGGSTSQPEQLQLPSFTNDICKELWIFWYGNEHEELKDFCEKLEQVQNDEFEQPASPPITYEVRTLYFKALHGVLERTLMKHGHSRIGRWFCRPFRSHNTGRTLHGSSQYLRAFNFQFFVHGGNTVCITLTTENKPMLIRLGKRHLETRKRIKVVIAPWSWKGEVIPAAEAGDPAKIQNIQNTQYDEFKEFFPIEPEVDSEDDWDSDEESDADKPEESDPPSPTQSCTPPPSPLPKPATPQAPLTPVTLPPTTTPTPTKGRPKSKGAAAAATAAAAAAAAVAAVAEEKKKEEEPEKPKKKKEHPFLEDGMPKMVVVEIAGVRFHYPTYLVYLTLEYDMECGNDSRTRDIHPIRVQEEYRVDETRKRNPVCVDELTSNSMIQSVFQSALLPKKIPAVPATPVGDFAAPYVAQADDDTKWNFIDPGRNEKCPDEPQHVENSNYEIENYDKYSEERCIAYHLRFHKDSREKFRRMQGKDPADFQLEKLNPGDVDEEDPDPTPPPPELFEKTIPSWILCNKEDKAEITVDSAAPDYSYNIAINSPSTSEEEAQQVTELVCSPFTPIKCISPCNTCEWPSTVGQEMPEEIFSQIFKPGGSSIPISASQADRASAYEHYYNPLMRDDPQFQPYHNKRVGEKRRASYPPPLPIPQSPDNPWSQETIPAVSSPIPDEAPEGIEKLKMKRSSTVPTKLDVSEEEIIPRKKGLKKKTISIAGESEAEEAEVDDFATDWNNDPENDYFTHFDRSGIGCDDYEEVDDEIPCTTEKEEEARQLGEPIFSGVEYSEEHQPMDVDHSVDNMLSPPASNEQYQPLSLKATGPPSVPDANQIFPTPPSVLETHQFSPAGMTSSVLSNLLHAPTIPSQLTQMEMDEMREGGLSKEQEEPMETEESPTISDEEFVRKQQKLVSIEDKHPEHTRIKNIIQRITDPAVVLQTPASVAKKVATIPDRFVLSEKLEPDEEPLPVDYLKLARLVAARPQKPYIEVPKSAPHTVGSSSNRINMIALNHENRTQQEHQKAYNVTFTAIQAPLAQQHPLAMGYPPYGRPGMPMRPGMHMGPPYGPPGQMGYGPMGMPFNPHGMNSPMGVPAGYPHMPSPMYSPMNPLGGMGNMAGMPISPLHGPMGHLGPGMGMNSAMGMHPSMSHHAMQQYHQQMQQQQQQRQMMMMGQMGHMGQHHPGMTPAGWNHPAAGGGMTPTGMTPGHDPNHHPMQSPVTGMPPHLLGAGGPGGPGMPVGPGAGNPMFSQAQMANPMVSSGISSQPQLPPIQQINRESARLSTYMQTLGKMALQPLKMRNLPLGNKPREKPASLSTIEIKYPSVPEASSLVLTIILQDTILDLHYDTSFDACPICSCNATIRTRELGLYLSPPEIVRKPTSIQQNIPIYSGFHWSPQQIQCNCGFSAVRHRYLSMYNGLFPEDAQEATGVTRDEAVTPALGPWANYDSKSVGISKYLMDSSVNSDKAVMNQMRIMCQKGYVGKEIFMLAYSQESLVRSLAPEDDCRGVPGSNSPYVVNYVDQTELLLLGNSAIDAALSPMRGPDRREVSHATFFHPWGIQVANELRHNDEEELLWLPCITEDLMPIFAEGMKIVKPSPDQTTIGGPLAWKDLTKMRQNSGKPKEEDCHPEPIPQIVVSNDKDMLRGSATMIAQWDKLRLGPVDQPKDILYLAVIPDNAEVHGSTLKYMEEMSAQYEKLRLGKHVALCFDEVREGIIRAGGRGRPGTKYHNKVFSFLDLVDKEVQDKTFIARLRLFTQQMEEAVASVLERNDCLFTREEFRRQVAQEARARKQHQLASAANGEKAHEEAMNPSPSKEDQPGGVTGERRPSCLEELLNADTSMPPANPPALTATVDPPLEPDEIPTEDYVTLPHIICIYVINPFTFDPDARTAVNARIAFAALLRTYNAVCSRIKALHRTQLMLEIISVEEVQAYNQLGPCFMHDGKGFSNPKQSTIWPGTAHKHGLEGACLLDRYSYNDEMYQRCFDIYRAPRVLTPECARVCQSRFMTKCGPGYSLFDAINQWALKTPPMLFTVPSSPYYLAPPPKLLYDPVLEKITQRPTDEIVLYVSYCIVGGDYLVGTITDELGRLNESCIINMKPNLKGTIVNMNSIQFKSKTQIQDAMLRFMNFIHGIVTQGLNCVRLVIGRLGKMGHGEFKAWTFLLSKGNLRKMSQKPKEGCKACHDTDGVSGMPKILSACAISFEAEPYLKIYSSALKIEPEHRRKTIPADLMTPGDIGVTHIMTFTVSPTIDMNSGEQMGNDHDDENMDDTGFMDFGEDDLGLGEFGSIMEDVGASVEGMEHPGSIRNFRTGTIDLTPYDQPADPLPNQPLATGFLISTSPAPDLPDWFWSSCPLKKKSNPLHFKASLHINTQSVGEGDDEDLTSVTGLTKKTTTKIVDGIEICHPLDNNKNDAVLRHVLETYNALSWLNMDRIEQDRVSCLPIHIQHLLRLYHAVTRIYL